MTAYALAPVTAQTFQDHLDKAFEVVGCEVPVDLKLIEVDDRSQGRPWPARFNPPFTLIFAGPPDRILLEGPRVLRLASGEMFQLYVIPIFTIDPQAQGQLYQVVFN